MKNIKQRAAKFHFKNDSPVNSVTAESLGKKICMYGLLSDFLKIVYNTLKYNFNIFSPPPPNTIGLWLKILQ